MKKILLLLIGFAALTVSAQNIIYVNQNATGNNDGTSWTDAFTDPSSVALSSTTSSGDTVWVATGTYYPTYDYTGDPTPTDPRTKVFGLNGIVLHIYGGFNGTETQLTQRDWIANPTILSGNIGLPGDETDNCYTVFRSDRNFTLDGFTISDGYANGISAGPTRYGGGLYIYSGTHDFVVKNCIIKDNKAHYDGGLYCGLSSSSAPKNVTIENTHFSNNLARWGGTFGFIVSSNTSGAQLNVTLSNCLINNNSTGIFESSTGGSFSGGRFSSTNTANAVEIKIINSTFTKNNDNGSSPSSERSLLEIQGQNINALIYNTIFWDNTINTTETSIGFGSNSAYAPTVSSYNTISKDTLSNLSFVGISTNNTHLNPLFTNPSSNDFTLQSTSQAINTGDTTGISNLIPAIDLNGNSRYVGNSIDLGCYENSCSVLNNITTSLNGTTITATENSAGVTYQWLDCNNNKAIIPNETAQSFTATTNGNYACQITNGCAIDTTACVSITGVGISENSINNQITVYPNPATTKLSIDNVELKISSIMIIDLTGKTVKTVIPANNTIDVSNLIKGIYFLQVQTEKGVINRKFIKA